MAIFNHYPRTISPPNFLASIIDIFKKHKTAISTELLEKGLESNQVLNILRDDLEAISFTVERGKRIKDKFIGLYILVKMAFHQ